MNAPYIRPPGAHVRYFRLPGKDGDPFQIKQIQINAARLGIAITSIWNAAGLYEGDVCLAMHSKDNTVIEDSLLPRVFKDVAKEYVEIR